MSKKTIAAFRDDVEYEPFLKSIRSYFRSAAPAGTHLFTTDAKGLFKKFLAALPPEERQNHTCNSCRHFVDKFGGLVTIDPAGIISSVLWNASAPGFYAKAFRVLARAVEKSKVTGVFLSGEKDWGQPKTGEWYHMAVTPPKGMVYFNPVKNAFQAMAEKHEEYSMLRRGLADFPHDLVATAVTILESDKLYRSEKCLGVAKFLFGLQGRMAASFTKELENNIVWLAVAGAPPGFCHVRSTMIGTLLEDLASGMRFEEVKRRFAEKMNPLQYQRPTAAPKAGNVLQAEKTVAALKSAGALDRRFARLEDIQEYVWSPAPDPKKAKASGGVFGHLLTHPAQRMDLGTQTMTWEKFQRTVLPTAEKIEYKTPGFRFPRGIALVTAAEPDAPPILQWDTEKRRNPVSWYVYPAGKQVRDWDLIPDTYVPVTAITRLPFAWGQSDPEKFKHQGDGVVFLLEGCRDLYPTGGAALFPEILKTDYHSIRSTIEAHSRTMEISGKEHATACGIDLRKSSSDKWDFQFRVTSKGTTSTYLIDRWD